VGTLSDICLVLCFALDTQQIQPKPSPACLIGDENASAVKDSPLSILVVEDNLMVQRITRKMIESLGHHVSVAENGAQAIQQVIHNGALSFDMIFMVMPTNLVLLIY
jgi:PleD family two-component response regulator